MKTLSSILSNPIVILIYFPFLIIAGELIANFYFEYLLNGLIRFRLFAFAGTIGWLLILINFLFATKDKFAGKISQYRYIVGCAFLLISLFMFFVQFYPNNYPTFTTSLPLIILVGFLICAAFFLYVRIFNLKHPSSK